MKNRFPVLCLILVVCFSFRCNHSHSKKIDEDYFFKIDHEKGLYEIGDYLVDCIGSKQDIKKVDRSVFLEDSTTDPFSFKYPKKIYKITLLIAHKAGYEREEILISWFQNTDDLINLRNKLEKGNYIKKTDILSNCEDCYANVGISKYSGQPDLIGFNYKNIFYEVSNHANDISDRKGMFMTAYKCSIKSGENFISKLAE